MDNRITVLLPGGYKPPHGGHLNLANKLASRPDVKKVIILVGPTERDGVSRDKSITVWNMLPKHQNVVVNAVDETNPMTAAFNYVFNLPKNSFDIIAMGASNKECVDAARSKTFKDAIEKYKKIPTRDNKYAPPNVKIVELTDTAPSVYVGRGDDMDGKYISSTTLRNDMISKNFKKFMTNYPGVNDLLLQRIFNILVNGQTYMNTLKREKVKKIIKKMLEEEGVIDGLFNDPDKTIKNIDKNIDALEDRMKKVQDLKKQMDEK